MKVEEILSKIVPINEEIYEQAKQKTSKLIMPYRAMGYLNDISEQLCAIYSSMSLKIENKAVFVMVADHGVAEEDVSAYPQQVTCKMIKAFIGGSATISVLARLNNCFTIVADVGTKCSLSETKQVGQNQFIVKKIKNGTNNFSIQPAMTKEEAHNSILAGFNIANDCITSQKIDLVATGDMGIANTTAASAVGACITKNPVELLSLIHI